jgi:hypothetical protein
LPFFVTSKEKSKFAVVNSINLDVTDFGPDDSNLRIRAEALRCIQWRSLWHQTDLSSRGVKSLAPHRSASIRRFTGRRRPC